jgi:hypothetical protein
MTGRRIIVSGLLALQLLLVPMFLAPARVSAAEADFCQQQIGGFFGLPTWYKYLDASFDAAPCEINFDARSAQSYVAVIMAVFEILMRIAGYAAVGIVMYGAFQFLTSQGEPDKYAAARTTILNAFIGLAIVLFAVAIVNLIGANVV